MRNSSFNASQAKAITVTRKGGEKYDIKPSQHARAFKRSESTEPVRGENCAGSTKQDRPRNAEATRDINPGFIRWLAGHGSEVKGGRTCKGLPECEANTTRSANRVRLDEDNRVRGKSVPAKSDVVVVASHGGSGRLTRQSGRMKRPHDLPDGNSKKNSREEIDKINPIDRFLKDRVSLYEAKKRRVVDPVLASLQQESCLSPLSQRLHLQDSGVLKGYKIPRRSSTCSSDDNSSRPPADENSSPSDKCRVRQESMTRPNLSSVTEVKNAHHTSYKTRWSGSVYIREKRFPHIEFVSKESLSHILPKRITFKNIVPTSNLDDYAPGVTLSEMTKGSRVNSDKSLIQCGFAMEKKPSDAWKENGSALSAKKQMATVVLEGGHRLCLLPTSSKAEGHHHNKDKHAADKYLKVRIICLWNALRPKHQEGSSKVKDTSRTKRTAANIKLSEASREPPIKKYKTTNLKQRTKEMKSKSGITGSDKIYSDNKKCSDAVTIRKVEDKWTIKSRNKQCLSADSCQTIKDRKLEKNDNLLHSSESPAERRNIIYHSKSKYHTSDNRIKKSTYNSEPKDGKGSHKTKKTDRNKKARKKLSSNLVSPVNKHPDISQSLTSNIDEKRYDEVDTHTPKGTASCSMSPENTTSSECVNDDSKDQPTSECVNAHTADQPTSDCVNAHTADQSTSECGSADTADQSTSECGSADTADQSTSEYVNYADTADQPSPNKTACKDDEETETYLRHTRNMITNEWGTVAKITCNQGTVLLNKSHEKVSSICDKFRAFTISNKCKNLSSGNSSWKETHKDLQALLYSLQALKVARQADQLLKLDYMNHIGQVKSKQMALWKVCDYLRGLRKTNPIIGKVLYYSTVIHLKLSQVLATSKCLEDSDTNDVNEVISDIPKLNKCNVNTDSETENGISNANTQSETEQGTDESGDDHVIEDDICEGMKLPISITIECDDDDGVDEPNIPTDVVQTSIGSSNADADVSSAETLIIAVPTHDDIAFIPTDCSITDGRMFDESDDTPNSQTGDAILSALQNTDSCSTLDYSDGHSVCLPEVNDGGVDFVNTNSENEPLSVEKDVQDVFIINDGEEISESQIDEESCLVHEAKGYVSNNLDKTDVIELNDDTIFERRNGSNNELSAHSRKTLVSGGDGCIETAGQIEPNAHISPSIIADQNVSPVTDQLSEDDENLADDCMVIACVQKNRRKKESVDNKYSLHMNPPQPVAQIPTEQIPSRHFMDALVQPLVVIQLGPQASTEHFIIAPTEDADSERTSIVAFDERAQVNITDADAEPANTTSITEQCRHDEGRTSVDLSCASNIELVPTVVTPIQQHDRPNIHNLLSDNNVPAPPLGQNEHLDCDRPLDLSLPSSRIMTPTMQSTVQGSEGPSIPDFHSADNLTSTTNVQLPPCNAAHGQQLHQPIGNAHTNSDTVTGSFINGTKQNSITQLRSFVTNRINCLQSQSMYTADAPRNAAWSTNPNKENLNSSCRLPISDVSTVNLQDIQVNKTNHAVSSSILTGLLNAPLHANPNLGHLGSHTYNNIPNNIQTSCENGNISHCLSQTNSELNVSQSSSNASSVGMNNHTSYAQYSANKNLQNILASKVGNAARHNKTFTKDGNKLHSVQNGRKTSRVQHPNSVNSRFASAPRQSVSNANFCPVPLPHLDPNLRSRTLEMGPFSQYNGQANGNNCTCSIAPFNSAAANYRQTASFPPPASSGYGARAPWSCMHGNVESTHFNMPTSNTLPNCNTTTGSAMPNYNMASTSDMASTSMMPNCNMANVMPNYNMPQEDVMRNCSTAPLGVRPPHYNMPPANMVPTCNIAPAGVMPNYNLPPHAMCHLPPPGTFPPSYNMNVPPQTPFPN